MPESRALGVCAADDRLDGDVDAPPVPSLRNDLNAVMQERRALDVPREGRPWRSAGYGLGLMISTSENLGRAIGHGGQGPASVASVFRFGDLDPARTVAAFAPTADQGVVEAAVLDAARS